MSRHAFDMMTRVNNAGPKNRRGSKSEPLRYPLVKRPENWRWSSYNNFAVDAKIVAGCPIEIDYTRLPEGYRA
jgi:hypothetical protein